MAEADLDVVIRQIAKAQNKNLIAAVKKRRDQIMARAAKAKDKETRDRFRLIAWDLPGLGRSVQPADGDYRLEKLARDLEAVLGLAGGRPAT